MAALFRQLPFGNDQDAAGILHRGQAVGDDESGSPLFKLAEGKLDLLFGFASRRRWLRREEDGASRRIAGR